MAEEIRRLGQDLFDIVRDIGLIADFPDDIKRDCTHLVRRIILLTHLFEDIKEFKGDQQQQLLLLPNSSHSPPASSSSSSSSSLRSCASLTDLLFALKAAKRLLLLHERSDYTVGRNLLQFQYVTSQLDKALGNIPYDHLDISDEVREQVELVRAQLRRATERNRSLNLRSFSDVSSFSSLIHDKAANPKILRSGSRKFQINNVSNSTHGFQEIEDPVAEVNGETKHNVEQLTHVLETLKNFVLSDSCEMNIADTKTVLADSYEMNIADTKIVRVGNKDPSDNKKPDCPVIPDDFRCPISLELMRDPVIVATGQTYERSSIQRWIDCGNKTCPKTQQKLPHLTLTPNYVLRSLITQWYEANKFEQLQGSSASGRIRKNNGCFLGDSEEKVAIEATVHKLFSQSVEEQRNAASEIRLLAKRSTNKRIMIAEAEAIPALVNLLSTDDSRTQENVVTAILNLSIYDNNKGLIMLAGAIPPIIEVLRMGTMEARENAAATLFSLSLIDENKITIGASGAIAALVELLQCGSSRGRKDAATALFNLCIYKENKGRAVRAGILLPLMDMLTNSSYCMVDEALTILSVLVSHQESKVAIAKANMIPVLIDLLRIGLPRNKENAAAILLALCKKDAINLACIARLGAVIPISELAKNGTDRAKRKATFLLEHLKKLQ